MLLHTVLYTLLIVQCKLSTANVHCKLYNAHCKLHTAKLQTAHCALYTANFKMQTKYVKCIKLYTAYNTAHSEVSASRPLHTIHFTLYILQNVHCTLCNVHCKLHIAHFKMHTEHSNLFTEHCNMYAAHFTCCTLQTVQLTLLYTAHRTLYS